MKKNLLIVGAGGHGRCCLDLAREAGCYDKINFLDDNGIGNIVNEAMIIDCVSNMDNYRTEYQSVFVAVGNNQMRESVMKKAEAVGFELISLISRNSVISPYAHIGEGVAIFPFAVVEANAEIGDGCVIAAHATINHDAKLESHTLVNSNSVIRPNVVLETNAMVGSHCVITFGKIIKKGERVLDGTVL